MNSFSVYNMTLYIMDSFSMAVPVRGACTMQSWCQRLAVAFDAAFGQASLAFDVIPLPIVKKKRYEPY